MHTPYRRSFASLAFEFIITLSTLIFLFIVWVIFAIAWILNRWGGWAVRWLLRCLQRDPALHKRPPAR